MSCCKGIAGEVREVRRSGGELRLNWKIPRFLDLPGGGLDFYESPRFCFCDARWHLRVWPDCFSSGDVHLSLLRDDDDDLGPSTRTAIFSLGVRGSGGGVERRREEAEREFEKEVSLFWSEICTRSELREQEERLMPGDALTVVCVMKVPGTAATGIDKVAEDMGKLLDSGKRCDVTVQVQETEFRVHSSILCARSPVLAAMLEHDTAERASDRITIHDCEADVFGEYLRYLYTGSVRSLSRQTVFGLYRVADQYLGR